MLYTLRFSLQNALYFIMLPFLVHVLFTFYIQGVSRNIGLEANGEKTTFSLSNIY